MNVEATALPGVLKITPEVFADARGCFFESFRAERYRAHGIPAAFAQDSVSESRKGVLRGLHFQWPNAQGKLVYVLEGEVFDVAADVRRSSPTFRRWVGHRLSAENREQLWIPEGFAHGFLVLSERAIFAYKCTAPYDATSEQSIRWDDADLAIKWPADRPLLSAKDAGAPRLRDIAPQRLPR
ncbi:MAG TPA: dTDP-4-dehydrorhamnose 3,5-epimerase [Planctomycetota bacterium]|nr:dTDP-4-dehydrorhamnose 3,5-epimerase [Planctomycetota bacterium]